MVMHVIPTIDWFSIYSFFCFQIDQVIVSSCDPEKPCWFLVQWQSGECIAHIYIREQETKVKNSTATIRFVVLNESHRYKAEICRAGIERQRQQTRACRCLLLPLHRPLRWCEEYGIYAFICTLSDGRRVSPSLSLPLFLSFSPWHYTFSYECDRTQNDAFSVCCMYAGESENETTV